jgi:hypothetical protein
MVVLKRSVEDVLLPILEPHGLHVLQYGKGFCHLVMKILLQMLQLLMKLSGNWTEKSTNKPKHLLWALHFMKCYPTEKQMSSAVKEDDKTLRKWVQIFIKALAGLNSKVVSCCKIVFFLYFILFHSHNPVFD